MTRPGWQLVSDIVDTWSQVLLIPESKLWVLQLLLPATFAYSKCYTTTNIMTEKGKPESQYLSIKLQLLFWIEIFFRKWPALLEKQLFDLKLLFAPGQFMPQGQTVASSVHQRVLLAGSLSFHWHSFFFFFLIGLLNTC